MARVSHTFRQLTPLFYTVSRDPFCIIHNEIFTVLLPKHQQQFPIFIFFCFIVYFNLSKALGVTFETTLVHGG